MQLNNKTVINVYCDVRLNPKLAAYEHKFELEYMNIISPKSHDVDAWCDAGQGFFLLKAFKLSVPLR